MCINLEVTMKKIFLAVLVATLASGCAVYVPGPAYGYGHGYYHHGYYRY
jgi:hypothetical protein